MRQILLVCSLAVALLLTLQPPGMSQSFSHLNPGGPASLSERVLVQVVFVGYEPAQVSQSAFLGQLPKTYRPVVRSRLWYGVTEFLGITYTYDYKVVYANSAYETAFFNALNNLSVPQASVDGLVRTPFQDLYNEQEGNVVEITDNYFIDAPSVEKWLIDNPVGGVDTRRNTIFFVNWWGRSNFKFHTYTKLGEPDPDTGLDFGFSRQSRKIIAWGGTTPDDEETGLGAARGVRRIWFYDLSAGPESWTDNWNVTDADVDGDGLADYRMPPIWEYLTPGGYRAASALASDLGRVARYVAINLLFTTSPLYPPYITPPRQPATINLDMNTYEGWTGVDASTAYQKPALLVQEVTGLHRIPYNVDQQELLFEGEARTCYVAWLRDVGCDPSRPQYPGSANLFLYNALNIETSWDGGGEYEAMGFNYATNDKLAAGFLGFADDNWIDGTQSFFFNFVNPGVVASGYGLTTTQIHEYGHHIGMSHPHDGYDFETAVDYGPEGAYYFAWSGDEHNSMMSYIDLNWDFSQFDRDNFDRFQTAAYIINANSIAKLILDSPGGGAALNDLNKADAAIGRAKNAFAAHNYVGAFNQAQLAYQHVRAGAVKAGVTVTPSGNGWFVLDPVVPRKSANKRKEAHQDKYGPTTHRSRP